MNKRLADAPEHVLSHFGLQGLGREEVSDLNDVVVSQSWIFEHVVLQARPVLLLERMLLLHQLSELEGALEGMRFIGKIMSDDGRYLSEATSSSKGRLLWSLQPRLESCALLYGKEFSPAKLLQNSMRVLPEAISQLRSLDRLVNAEMLKGLPESRGTEGQKASSRSLASELILAYPQLAQVADLPAKEKYSPLVAAHGDPVLKNIILTSQGAKLIDFEAIALLPRHMDLVHMAAFVCKRSPFESWSLILESYWQLCQEELEGWAFEDWQLSACWYLIRELLFFPPSTGLGNYLQGLSRQIKLCLV